MKKRWTAWALTLAMLAGALPGTALAAEDGGALLITDTLITSSVESRDILWFWN